MIHGFTAAPGGTVEGGIAGVGLLEAGAGIVGLGAICGGVDNTPFAGL